MNEAFLDRWQILFISDLPAKEELKILKNKVGGLKTRWARGIVEFAQKVRSRSVQGLDLSSDTFSTRRVLAWAKKTALLRDPIAGAKLAWLDKLPASEHEVINRLLLLHFGSGKKRAEKDSSNQIIKEKSPDQGTKKRRGRPPGSKNKTI